MLDEATVTKRLTSAGSRNLYGVATYATLSSPFRGRYVRKNRLVRAFTGDERVSRSHFYFYGTPGLDPEDRVALPDGTSPPVLSVRRYPDENGAHHEVAYFGAAGTAGGVRVTTMRWYGTRSLQRRLATIAATAPRALGAALFIEAHRILAVSTRTTPRLTGALRATGT